MANMTGCDLRLGRWQDVLGDVEACDTLYSDPPFSARTHTGYRSGEDFNHANRIGYEPITEELVRAFVASWTARVHGWVVLHTDHTAWRWWEAAWSAVGFHAFQPVPWIKVDAGPRMQGDGPAVGVEWLFVARTRGWPMDRGSRPSHYMVQVDKSPTEKRIVGCKRVKDMANVLLDYSSPGNLVCDPFAGTGTLGIACLRTGRRWIGAEVDPKTTRMAAERLKRETAQAVMPLGGWPDRWRKAQDGQVRLL